MGDIGRISHKVIWQGCRGYRDSYGHKYVMDMKTVYRSPSVSRVLRWTGYSPTWRAGWSVCDVVRLGRHIKPCGLACHRGLSWAPYCSSYTLLAWSISLRDMVLTFIYMPTISRYRALVALGLLTSSNPSCRQLAWTKCLTGCCRIVYSWTLRKQRSSGVRPLVGRTIYYVLLLVSERTTCCPRQLFVTLEFSSTAMSLCGLMLAPRYLSDYIQSVAVSNCRCLRSSSSS